MAYIKVSVRMKVLNNMYSRALSIRINFITTYAKNIFNMVDSSLLEERYDATVVFVFFTHYLYQTRISW